MKARRRLVGALELVTVTAWGPEDHTVDGLKITTACQVTNEITLEAWVTPANLTQSGPARIFTVSAAVWTRNLMLGQDNGDDYLARLRTSNTDDNGFPELQVANSVTLSLTHVVFTRQSDGNESLYLDGTQAGSGVRSGDFSNWASDFNLALGREFNTGDRAWLGTIHMIAVYDRALSPAEVTHNYDAGPQ